MSCVFLHMVLKLYHFRAPIPDSRRYLFFHNYLPICYSLIKLLFNFSKCQFNCYLRYATSIPHTGTICNISCKYAPYEIIYISQKISAFFSQCYALLCSLASNVTLLFSMFSESYKFIISINQQLSSVSAA